MSFAFYPQHEYHCPHVGSCPHVGGAALGSLVACANENQAVQEARQRVREAERATKTQLLARVAALEVELEQTKAELRLERRGKFCPVEAAESEASPTAAEPTPEREAKKRGAPVGHPGWFRPRPAKADRTVAVAAPAACPHCGGAVRVDDQLPVEEHFQEDLHGGLCQTTCFQHPQARCVVCRRWVQQAGEGELLGQRIGPQARARAIWLRDHVGLTWRKGARILEGLLGLKVRPAAFWFHGDERLAHFHFDESRAGEVSRGILGDDFAGTLVTDCSTVSWQHAARWKQKCLAHLRRTARDWKAVVGARPLAHQFFEDVQAWVQRGCEFHRQRRKGRLTNRQSAAEKRWLREDLKRREQCLVDHPKAATLQARLRTYHDDWLVFLDHPGNCVLLAGCSGISTTPARSLPGRVVLPRRRRGPRGARAVGPASGCVWRALVAPSLPRSVSSCDSLPAAPQSLTCVRRGADARWRAFARRTAWLRLSSGAAARSAAARPPVPASSSLALVTQPSNPRFGRGRLVAADCPPISAVWELNCYRPKKHDNGS